MPYIYEHPNWPEMTWDTKLLSKLCSDVRYKQGKHFGKMSSLGFDLKNQAFLTSFTEEVVKTSSIEGENLNTEDVRSSIARKLGMKVGGLVDSNSREIDGIVELIVDATKNYHQPLNEDRLCSWHRCLFPKGKLIPFGISVGKWRNDENGPMQVISGAIGKEIVHYQAPKASRIAKEMKRFFLWYNDQKNEESLIRAAVSHFWFVTIHPFDDGNGRIGRAITEMELSRSDQSEDRFYSMSAQIFKERKDYYEQLKIAQKSRLDITSWVEWFLGCLSRSIDSSENHLKGILEKTKIWEKVNKFVLNERQKKVINKLLDNFEGNLTSIKYSRMTKCSKETAIRDIQDLMKKSILIKNEFGGRSTSYRIVTLEEIKSSI
jgi:Fic family protein